MFSSTSSTTTCNLWCTYEDNRKKNMNQLTCSLNQKKALWHASSTKNKTLGAREPDWPVAWSSIRINHMHGISLWESNAADELSVIIENLSLKRIYPNISNLFQLVTIHAKRNQWDNWYHWSNHLKKNAKLLKKLQ